MDSNQIEVFSDLAERETNANTLENTLLNYEQIKSLSTENKSLKSENKRQKTEIIQLKEQFQNELKNSLSLLTVLKVMTSCLDFIPGCRITKHSKAYSPVLVQQ